MNILAIDTTDNTKIFVSLKINEKEYKKEEKVISRSSQRTLPLILSLLKEHHLTPKDLDTVEVQVGPGSFTGTRVGVGIANALAFALEIPVNNTRIINGQTLVEPVYS